MRAIVHDTYGSPDVLRLRQKVVLAELVESGKLTPVIEATYPLAETPAALRHIEEGHVRGKIVITL